MPFELITVKIEPEDDFDTGSIKQEVCDDLIKTETESQQGESNIAGNIQESDSRDGAGKVKEEVSDIYPVELVKVKIEEVVTNAREENEPRGDFPCHLCGAAFQYLSHVTKHLNEHIRQTFPCPNCNREFIQASDLEAHQVFHKVSTLHPCETCGEKFITKELLEKHSEEHGTEGAFECPICHRKLKAKYSLKIHMSALHSTNKPFSCEECHMRFPAQWRLRQHMKLHTGDGFPCSYCEKQFLSQAKLDVHVLSHTGEKPVECPMCNKRFTRNHNLKVHMRMHTGEKKFVCDFENCVKAFFTKSDLTSHKAAVHSKDKPRPFKCSQSLLPGANATAAAAKRTLADSAAVAAMACVPGGRATN
ncbi:hypothetical protein MSG28_010824 [Choristoneura fumiferana]|uniref:Uncharacterized protein n=1 Tax=Choristoneura fumiferana TaxID=7141 RepID=A0ACC0KNQ5_CHOFU|nr:hypothetical protein MSG28_010824 [Choristoneura fumiferana]